jgi:hypothetical protein
MNYQQKLTIANEYLSDYGVEWDDLCDINSLHDCEDDEEIIDACNCRLEESGFGF